MQIIETQDRRNFDNFLAANGASVLQSWAWGEFQKKLGRKVWRLLLSKNAGTILAACTVVRMPLPAGKFYFYAPRGPVIADYLRLPQIWQLILDKLGDYALVDKPLFLRIDPSVSGYGLNFQLQSLGFQKLTWEIQPKDTLILDLQKTEEQLLHEAKPKTRYNINLAQRKEVSVEHYRDGRKVKEFWALMQETTRRDKFSPHPYTYYSNLLEVLGRADCAELFLAYYQNRPLAGIIVSYYGGVATYLHGASSDRFRTVMAPYLLQWSAITTAHGRGLKFYDFNGIAPANSRNHPWEGLSRFKKGFGGRAVSYIGAYDLVYDKFWYKLYLLARGLSRVI